MVQYKGGKLLHKLETGRGVLQTAAISKDGNRAVTLSANIYDGQRRIQMWDLDTRAKVEERFCSGATEMLYLTDHGDWMIGLENGRFWMWKWEDADQRFYRGEHFISETDRGLTTYGNSLLFQSEDGRLQLFHLDGKSVQSFGTYEPIKYATVLRENRIATVSQSERYVEFSSVRDDRLLELNLETSKIRGVHAFKTQPFIAVVTSDGMVSMYHVGTGQRTRKLRSSMGFRLLAFHPDQNVFSFSDGQRRIETFRYFEWKDHGAPRGKWCEPRHPNFIIDGKIIAIGFNTLQEEQIIIETNGKITYMQDRFCDFHSQTKVITNFSVNGYDFSGVICSEEIKKQLIRNGAEFAEYAF